MLLLCSLVAVLTWQWRTLEDRESRIAVLRNEVQQKAERADELEISRQRLIAQKRELLEQTSALATQATTANPVLGTVVSPRPSAPGNTSESEQGAVGKLIAKMMDDPEAREMIRQPAPLPFGVLLKDPAVPVPLPGGGAAPWIGQCGLDSSLSALIMRASFE